MVWCPKHAVIFPSRCLRSLAPSPDVRVPWFCLRTLPRPLDAGAPPARSRAAACLEKSGRVLLPRPLDAGALRLPVRRRVALGLRQGETTKESSLPVVDEPAGIGRSSRICAGKEKHKRTGSRPSIRPRQEKAVAARAEARGRPDLTRAEARCRPEMVRAIDAESVRGLGH
ncbi:hypothetical protein BS78_03G184600 [Paspalum vaginatum]|nr:hypothetical protein BS78_03G184600 [Paspalum vaginatum]